mgnify:FL=1
MRRCADHKRIIVAILIAALSILCAFHGNDSISEVHHTEQVCLQKSHTAISDTTLRKIEGTENFENNLTSKMRSSERIERLRASRKNGCTVSYLACLAMQRQMQSLSVGIPEMLVQSDLTPRYSVILYLHRSDGKKSNLFA